ncbi:MAG: serine/threonine protein kinase [Labilithrix sp.]|nr:serine/threonine protein kinase [Labilithrix sp.]
MDVAYASARDRLGRTLCGKYHLEEVLGVGGTAVVFKATHRNGNKVAVKMLHDHLGRSKEVGRRFLREGYLANILEHPGTVRVLDDDADENGVAYLVLELLEGETLEERRVRLGGRLPVDEVLGYMDRLLEVLELAHEKNIVHRDIKPSNIFLTKEGTLKVLDFGIARILDDSGAATATKTGQMIGTPAFMPPEQALSKPKEIDKQTDIWAVGATMFTLLSGELVHVAETTSEHLVKAATVPARSVARVLPGVPANVEALTARALKFEKVDRWATVTEMRQALWKVRLDPGRPIGTSSKPPPGMHKPSSNYPTLVAKRDSEGPRRDSGGLPESGLSLTGERVDAAGRRAVIFSSIAAVLLVASALTFAIYMTVSQKPKSLTRTAAAATAIPVPVTTDTTPVDLSTAPSLPSAPATGVTTASAPPPPAPVPSPSVSTAKPPAQPNVQASPPPVHAPPTPKATPTADLYKPF